MQPWHLVYQPLHKIGLREASWVSEPCLLLSQAPCRIIPFINTAAAGGEKPGMAKDAEREVLWGLESGGFGVCKECSFVLFRRAT